MFQPANGGLSRREVVYQAVRSLPTDELIPYAKLPYDQETLGGLREKVSKLFEREQQRHVVCIKGEGWMIVSGSRQVEEAVRRQRHVTRRQGRVLQIAETADRRDMSGEERLRADATLIAAKTSYGMLRGLAIRKPGVEDVKAWQERQASAR